MTVARGKIYEMVHAITSVGRVCCKVAVTFHLELGNNYLLDAYALLC